MDLELRGKTVLVTGASKGVRVIGVNPGRIETERQVEAMMDAAERKLGDRARFLHQRDRRQHRRRAVAALLKASAVSLTTSEKPLPLQTRPAARSRWLLDRDLR